MSIYAAVRSVGASGFGYGSTAEKVSAGLELSGRRYLVTGCNSGLGAETVRVLKLRGATVIGAARSLEKTANCDEGVVCDLGDLATVRAAVAAVQGPLHGIIANAGIMALPDLQLIDGVERQFSTNHLGHFVLVTGLQPLLTDDGRVVILASGAHKAAPKQVGIDFDNLDGSKGYSAWTAYGRSKLANLLFAKELATRVQPGQSVFSVHPGVIATNLTRHMNPLMQLAWKAAAPLALKTEAQGAATQVWAALHPDAPKHSGEYLADCNVARTSRHGRDAELAKQLWTETERLLSR